MDHPLAGFAHCTPGIAVSRPTDGRVHIGTRHSNISACSVYCLSVSRRPVGLTGAECVLLVSLSSSSGSRRDVEARTDELVQRVHGIHP